MTDKPDQDKDEQSEFDSIDGVLTSTLQADDELLDDIRDLIDSKQRGALINILADLHPADIAEIIDHLNQDESAYILELMDAETASQVLVEVEETTRDHLLDRIPHPRLSKIVDELESDDATDIVAELPKEVADKVLDTLPEEDSDELKKLLRYPEDSAGGIMGTEFIALPTTATVQDATEAVRELAEETEDIYAIFVTGEDEQLVGVVSLKALLLNPSYKRLEDIMDPEVIFVRVDVDQEDVANVMRKYDLIAIPVTDENNRVVGVINFDDIADVIDEEAQEDLQRMSGLSGEDPRRGITGVMRTRLPWLLLGLVGEIVAALVLMSFDATLKQVVASAFFIPIVMAMGGISGNQAAAVVVRDIATGETEYGHTLLRIGKEFLSALLNGLAIGVIILLIVSIWTSDVMFGITLALSLITVVINATVVGAGVPYILHKLNFDPAIATGPFISTTNDALGILIYLSFCSLIYLN